MSNYLSFILSLLLLAAVLFLFSIPFGPLPAIGSFFHPTQGFWANAETHSATGQMELSSEGLTEEVEIFYDERDVPHIFAQNDSDLYFAQGYVTARDRLFQMELQIRAAGGRLAEWLGSDLVEYDLHQRRLGMMLGAERAMEGIMEDETISNVIQAYSEGVNAYINTLQYQNYPLEYKILGVEPERWEPFKTALLLKYMTQMLASRSEDFRSSNTMARFGEDFVNRFLSSRPRLMEPVVPPRTDWDFETLETESPENLHQPSFTKDISRWQPNPLNGSNNWVVDGSKTAGGYSILSNDMHLGMSLPAIWYEIQLHTPDSNVYGVSLQGAPTVIVGFNNYIAWGSTNTGADVMDWYEITFQDENRTHYLHDDEWKTVNKHVETIHVKDGEAIQDTILMTHHGPVYEAGRDTLASQTIQRNHALKWIAHESSNELLTFYKLNRAEGYDDFRDAFRTYQAPAQNMNYAGTDGNIAIQTGGRFPLKWEFQGRTVSDGSDSRYDWDGFIPYEQNPHALNPERGFLSAANQYPAEENYPYYLGDSFAPYERGRRINDLLGDMEEIIVEDFKEMQMDQFSYHAYRILPEMLEEARGLELNESEQEFIEKLESWNYSNDGDKIEPSLFKAWWEELYAAIWNNKYQSEYPMRRPARDITADLILDEPDSQLFDNINTQERETLGDLIDNSFKRGIERLKTRYGDSPENWMWSIVNNTDLNHVGQIPGLGIQDLLTGGGAESINAIRGSHGPSWRMIVELDPEGVRGYGVYPGGQSGNPGSKTYDEFVEIWRTGELYELQYFREKPGTDDFPLVIRFEQ